jgi:hypothetical protein
MNIADTIQRPFSQDDLGPVPMGWRVGPPDFVGVGCGKAGSTWWHSLVAQHPQVVPNRVGLKELHYFSHFSWEKPDNAAIELYRSAFARPPGHLCGEWSASFLFAPFALEGLAQAAPDAKLVLTVRNPVDRVASLLNQFLVYRARLVGAEGDAATVFRRWSLFPEAMHKARIADGITRLFDLFPRENIHIVQYETAKKRTKSELVRTLDFLGLDSTWSPNNASRHVHRQPYVIEKPNADERARIADWLRCDVERTAQLLPEIDINLWPEFAGGLRSNEADAGSLIGAS